MGVLKTGETKIILLSSCPMLFTPGQRFLSATITFPYGNYIAAENVKIFILYQFTTLIVYQKSGPESLDFDELIEWTQCVVKVLMSLKFKFKPLIISITFLGTPAGKTNWSLNVSSKRSTHLMAIKSTRSDPYKSWINNTPLHRYLLFRPFCRSVI